MASPVDDRLVVLNEQRKHARSSREELGNGLLAHTNNSGAHIIATRSQGKKKAILWEVLAGSADAGP